MATNSREARRRRIVERGSDRLALITGRRQTLPSSTESEPPSLHNNNQQFSTTPDFPQIENKDCVAESALLNNDDDRIQEQPIMRKRETRVEPSRSPAFELDGKVQPSLVLSTVQNSSSVSTPNRDPHFEPQTRQRKVFTPSHISSAITATEGTRIYFSVAAAFFVVLSYIGFPILGSFIIKGVLLSRPLYLVLLTNISIVLARLLLGKQGRVERVEQEASNVPLEGGFRLDQVGKALESGLVLQKIISALFMDCSVYAIVVICGLSMAQRLSW